MNAKSFVISSLSAFLISTVSAQTGLPEDGQASAGNVPEVSAAPTGHIRQEAPSEQTTEVAHPKLPDKQTEEKINKLIEQAEIQLYGDGVPVDLSKAAALYAQAAELGSPKAMMRLSALYRKGIGVEKSLDKTVELTRKAAELGYAPAQAAMGISYLEGIGVEKNETLGNEWIEKAAESGHALSRVMAGERLLKAENDPAAQQKGKLFIDSILDNASPQELYTISYSFGHGLRLPKDSEKAKYWAKAACEKGSKNGAYYLGELYWNENDGQNALKYFEKAAEMGLPEAQLQTGRLYRDGSEKITKDPEKALFWLTRALSICSPEDILSICHLYLAGPAKIKNKEEAQKYLDLYLVRATPEELHENAEKYWKGIGVRKNFDLGGALALGALRKEKEPKVCDYAIKLAAPNWLRADFVTAYAILNQCVLNKNATEEERAAFDNLEKKMSAEQLHEAQDLSAQDALEQYLNTHLPTLK